MADRPWPAAAWHLSRAYDDATRLYALLSGLKIEAGQGGVETLPVVADPGLRPGVRHEDMILAGVAVDVGKAIDDARRDTACAAERRQQLHGALLPPRVADELRRAEACLNYARLKGNTRLFDDYEWVYAAQRRALEHIATP